ncbi:S-layer homology domain-containing protein [Paenibacillus sp. WLX2291]|uniref:S-layer homology domain-containing protein n=1 Tax=Paenibacillus sp. WLX2291 TaxID=3296934 RepID=UPI00398412EF
MNKTLLLLLMIVVVLAGCSKNAAQQPASTAAPTTQQDTTNNEDTTNTIVDPLAQPVLVQVVVSGGEAAAQSSDTAVPADIAQIPEKEQITKLLASGAVPLDSGENFNPDEPITRSQFIHWMYGYDNKNIKPKDAKTPSFSDVDATNPDYKLIEGLQNAGVITGFPDGTMKLEKELTRQELTLLWGWYQRERSITNPIVDKSIMEFVLNKYKDGNTIGDTYVFAVSHYAKDEQHSLEQVFDVKDTLEPQQPVTRAQAAHWIVDKTVINDQQKEQQEKTAELEQEAEQPSSESTAQNTVTVNDIATSSVQWQIAALLRAGIAATDEQGNFQPDESITRRDFIRWMHGYDYKELKDADQAPAAFSDVDTADPDYALVEQMRKADVLPALDQDNALKLDEPLTREQLALLWAWYQDMNSVKDPILALSTVQDSLFTIGDAKDIGKPYQNKEPYIRAVATFAYGEPTYRNVFGFTTLLKPQADVSRAEAAQWLVEYTDK